MKKSSRRGTINWRTRSIIEPRAEEELAQRSDGRWRRKRRRRWRRVWGSEEKTSIAAAAVIDDAMACNRGLIVQKSLHSGIS